MLYIVSIQYWGYTVLNLNIISQSPSSDSSNKNLKSVKTGKVCDAQGFIHSFSWMFRAMT